MAKKILILGIMFIMALGFFTGCSSGIKFNVAYDAKGSFGHREVDDEASAFYTLGFVSSLQELKDLCDEWNNPAFDESSESFSNELSTKIRNYDEAYFSEKILIIYSFDRGHGKETRITGINLDREQLTVNARYINKRGAFTAEAFIWLILIEVNKADIAGANTIQVVYK